MFMSPPPGEHWATMCAWQSWKKKDTVLQNKMACYRSCGQARGLLEKGLMGGWNQNRTSWFKWEAIIIGEKKVVVVVSWLRPVLLHLGQDSLPLLMGQWMNLKRTWVLQQDNNPKHTSHSTKEWLKKNKINVLEWLSQSPNLNPIKMLRMDLSKQWT